MSFPLTQSCIFIPSVVSAGFANFLWFSTLFTCPPIRDPPPPATVVFFYILFLSGFPPPQPPFTGSTLTNTIQYVSVSPSVVRWTFSLAFFVASLNANRFFTCHCVCIWSLFQGSYFFLYLCIVYYCIFKNIISNILVCLVKFISNKFVPEKKLYPIKTLLQKEKINEKVLK